MYFCTIEGSNQRKLHKINFIYAQSYLCNHIAWRSNISSATQTKKGPPVHSDVSAKWRVQAKGFFFAFSVFTSMPCEKSLDVLLGKIPTSDCSCPESILIWKSVIYLPRQKSKHHPKNTLAFISFSPSFKSEKKIVVFEAGMSSPNKTIKFDLLQIREKKTCPGDPWPIYSGKVRTLQHPQYTTKIALETFANQILLVSQTSATFWSSFR